MEMERLTVEKNFHGMEAAFIEPKVNKEASTFITEHLEEIRKQVRKMNISIDMVDDIISDVWLSIHEAELRGEGFDVSHSDDGDLITVEEFVYGRIKRYSMNSRYHSDVSERHLSKDRTRSVEVYSASCMDSSDLDNLDAFQKAYALAASYDDISDIEAEMSLKSNIELCTDYNNIVGFNVINFFKNIDTINVMLSGKVEFNTGIFDRLKDAMAKHPDFCTAFKEVMMMATHKKPVFESIVGSMT